jgi:hypothetical protein
MQNVELTPSSTPTNMPEVLYENRFLLQELYAQTYEQLAILSGLFDHPLRKTLKRL